jgi:hypothetical protein
VLACLAQGDAKQEWPWPPPGAQWETSPMRAMERARLEKKPILVYIATAD